MFRPTSLIPASRSNESSSSAIGADRQGPAGFGSWDLWAERWLSEVLENNRDRLRATDLPAAARLMIDMASGTLHRIIETRPQALGDPPLVEQLTELTRGYLLV